MRKYEEDDLLIQCVKWADEYFALKHPHLMLRQVDSKGNVRMIAPLVHTANERATSPQAGARLKRKGVRAGYPDLRLDVPRGANSALYVELKSSKGRLSENQKCWFEYLSTRSGHYEVVRELSRFVATVTWYMGIRTK